MFPSLQVGNHLEATSGSAVLEGCELAGTYQYLSHISWLNNQPRTLRKPRGIKLGGI